MPSPRLAAVLVPTLAFAATNGAESPALRLSSDLATTQITEITLRGAAWDEGRSRGRQPLLLSASPALAPGQRTTIQLTFTPQADGRIRLALGGLATSNAGANDLVWDDLRLSGADLANSGFETWEGGVPASWKTPTPALVSRIDDPWLVAAGTTAVRCAPQAQLTQELAVRAGQRCTLVATVGRHGTQPVRALALPAGPARPAEVWTTTGFSPEILRLPAGEREIAGIGFRLPSAGKGPHLVGSGPLTLTLPDGAISDLYLLHAAAAAPAGPDAVVGTLTPRTAAGQALPAIPVRWGTDVGAWARPQHLVNAVAGWKEPVNGPDSLSSSQATTWVGWYVSRFALPAGTTTIDVAGAAGTAWVMAGASVARSPIDLRRPEEETVTEDATWRPIAIRHLRQPGSALDLTGLLDAPAGRHGFVTIADGHLAFTDGTRARFSGTNYTVLEAAALRVSDARIDELADRFARLGINLVRVPPLDRQIRIETAQGPGLDPEAIDRFDRFTAACVRRGIYVTTELMMGYTGQPIIQRRYPGAHPGTVPRSIYQVGVLTDPEFMADLQTWTRVMLTHVNPYTGRSYAAEPAIAFVGMNNEDPLALHLSPREQAKLPAAQRKDLARRLADFLRSRYGDEAGLVAAWDGMLDPGESLATGVAVDLASSGRRRNDTLAFILDLQAGTWAAMDAYVRSLGLRVPLTDANNTTTPFATVLRQRFPAVDMHAYFDHRKQGRDTGIMPLTFSQHAMLRPERWWSRDFPFNLAAARLAGKPYTISEYDACYPNRNRAESGLVFGAMAALQDWDGLMQFTYGSVGESIWSESYHAKCFDLATDPIKLATETQLRFLYLRGDVHPAPGMVEVRADAADYLDGADYKAGEADLLPLVTRVGRGFTPGAPATGPVIAIGRSSDPAALPRPAGSEPDDLFRWFAAVRERILPPGNPSDPARGLLVSATGEITWDFAARQVRIDTPRSRGVVVHDRASVALAGVRLDLDAGTATASVHSLDAEPIANSRRLLVVFATDAHNAGEHSEDGGRTIYAWGSPQRLLRTGSLRLALTSTRPLAAWALGLDGRRLAPVAVERHAGEIELTCDQRQTPTVFWELAEEGSP